ncbi:MAG: SAM-dependent methyltransferase, partial [Lachnospiraceae bacterium]|nr:SAM-dependent methyltransferase [Lachnospiraceae bacterium]
YSYVRIEEITTLADLAELTRVKLVASDGPANYMRRMLTDMNEETFDLFMEYHYATCERKDLLGASGHTLDILQRK